MITKPILDSEIASLKIASLPSRPTAPVSFGGRGYTAGQMKAAFDALPLFIIERLNELIDELNQDGLSSVLLSAPSGIREGHTVTDLIDDITSGRLAEYLVAGEDETLKGIIVRLSERIRTLEEMTHYSDDDFHLDGGSPALRFGEVSA